MKKIILVLLILASSVFVGCATGKANIRGYIKVADTVKLAEQINPEAKVVAGIDKSENIKTETKQSAARDLIQSNDTEMIKELIRKNKEMVSQLIASNNRTIYILIVQLCALLTLFIKKDWDMDKRISEKDERIQSMLIKMISEDEAREDKQGGI